MPKSIGEQNYEQMAERFARRVPTYSYNAYLERPATLSLLPDVKGLRVLDAGCGSGIYAEWLVDRGAEVVAFDVTPALVEIAGRSLAGRATVLRADLARRLDFAEDASFDVVLSPLVMDYIEDWRSVFGEFYRVLRPGGMLVFSVPHPMDDYLRYLEKISADGSYFDTILYEMPGTSYGEPCPVIKMYRRPLGEMLNPLVDAGFRLDRVLEPQPTEQFKETDPIRYEKCIRQPAFLCIKAMKPESHGR